MIRDLLWFLELITGATAEAMRGMTLSDRGDATSAAGSTLADHLRGGARSLCGFIALRRPTAGAVAPLEIERAISFLAGRLEMADPDELADARRVFDRALLPRIRGAGRKIAFTPSDFTAFVARGILVAAQAHHRNHKCPLADVRHGMRIATDAHP